MRLPEEEPLINDREEPVVENPIGSYESPIFNPVPETKDSSDAYIYVLLIGGTVAIILLLMYLL